MITPTSPARSLRRRAAALRREAGRTPGHLKVLSLQIGLTAAALWLVGTGALVAAQTAISSMHHQTVPGIVGVQRIHASLADADRAEANAFLAGAIEAAGPHRQYESDIAAAVQQLEQAAEKDAGNPAIGQQIQLILVEVHQYGSLIDVARADNLQGFPTGAAYLRRASDLMHRPGDGILARVAELGNLEAGDLDRKNITVLAAAGLLVLYTVLATALLAQLVHAQRYVRERFRRLRTPRLVAATSLLVILAASLGAESIVTGQMLHVAEGQAYGRLLNLWHVRSLVYDANGDESLSLIARGGGDAFDRDFQRATAHLADQPMTDTLVLRAARGDVRFHGLLADELHASSGDERNAALDLLVAYRRFMGVDATVRARSQEGDHDSAARLALGSQPGQLGAAFAGVDAAIGRCISAIQRDFDLAISVSEYSLAGSAVIQVLSLVVSLLAYRGLKPRIDEYGKYRP